ncbi:MAG: DUF2007 domain-containing protein [bacterium]|nr:DUF2007 domain-containing protein [bacterium]
MFCPNPECPDFKATGAAPEFRPDVIVCPKCGTGLIAERPDMPDYEEFVPVMTIEEGTLVPIVQGLLEGAGIHFFIKNERAQELVGWGRIGSGYNVATAPPVVIVEPSRADEARALLQEIEPDKEGADPSATD